MYWQARNTPLLENIVKLNFRWYGTFKLSLYQIFSYCTWNACCIFRHMISDARVLAFDHIMSPCDVDWLHLFFPQLADRKEKGKYLNHTFHTFESWIRESHLFWSRHAIRCRMEYTVNSFTHFVEGGIFSDVTLWEKGKKINIYLVNVSIIFKKLLNSYLFT